MKNKWLYIGVVAVVIIALVAAFAPRKVNMIDFTDTLDQYISFGDLPAVRDLSKKTISFAIVIDDFGDGSHSYGAISKNDGTHGFQSYIGTSSRFVALRQYFSTADGLWTSPNNSLNTGLNFVTITYDNASASNDPVIYINGQSVAVTETSTPSGSAVSDAGYDLHVGSSVSGTYSPDGKLLDVRIYNRILSAAEVAELYNARSVTANDNGLVFHATLDGAAGVSNFDGAVLSASNTVVDRIGGAVGVPAGSPVGASDTVMSWGGW